MITTDSFLVGASLFALTGYVAFFFQFGIRSQKSGGFGFDLMF